MSYIKLGVLYLVPVASIAIFGYYVVTAGTGDVAAWGAAHGVHESIVRNYRWVNSITLLAWVTVLVAAVLRQSSIARFAATFAVAYVLCDIVFYIPMAKLAGEPFPVDQLVIFAIQVLYLVFIPTLNRPSPLR